MCRTLLLCLSLLVISITAGAEDYFYRLNAQGLSGLSGMDGRSHIGRARDGFDGFNGSDGRDGDDGRHGEEGKEGRTGGHGGEILLWMTPGSQPDYLHIRAEVQRPGSGEPTLVNEEVQVVPDQKILLYAVGGTGGSGGRGGNGQDGGDGGEGGDVRGFGHRSGDGGNGGNGGNAGLGGAGADGGPGGRVVVHLSAGHEDLANLLEIRVHGGLGGRAGMNGRPGSGGRGGRAGDPCYYDRGERKCVSRGFSGRSGFSGRTATGFPQNGAMGPSGNVDFVSLPSVGVSTK
ncbi:MAG: hypothetical protein H6624_07200 [Bdellovibrionaceae bacterium]|nr:hypothetical protein [Bdellovibrionales bacterium]MCB9084114.1 hypothetical protein [Pseudobdellovibrionaceae bacterium]